MFPYMFLCLLCCIAIVFGDKAKLVIEATKPRFQYREHHNYTVRIQRRDKKGKYHYICSGAILNSKYILTAAHAIDEIDPQDLRIVYDSNLKEYSKTIYAPRHGNSRTTEGYGVFKKFLHPKWVVGNKVLPNENDIALLLATRHIKLPKFYDGLYIPKAQPLLKKHLQFELPNTVGVVNVYKSLETTPISCVEAFEDQGCEEHQLDPSISTNPIEGFMCDKTVGAPVYQRRVHYHDILMGIIILEVLPINKAPVSIYVAVTPHIDFIKSIINHKVNKVNYVKK